MPVLDNPRHEKYAQALALGKSADEAYVLAGYSENRGNAGRLKTNEYVAARVREILAAACDEVVIERKWILGELYKIANVDFGHEHVSVAEKRRALVDIARIQGEIIERHELQGRLTISHEDALKALA